MDILAARKKAAERAKTAKPAEQPEALPGAPPAVAVPAAEAGAPSPEPARHAAADVAAPALPEAGEPLAEPATESAAPGESASATQLAAAERDMEMLSVLLDDEEYAVPVERVREVLTPREITPVPHTPPHILGVCSLRGAVLPIIDLKQRLGLAKTDINEKTRVVVAGVEDDEQIGLLVDRVRGVVRFPPSAIRPVPETLDQGAEFLSGIVRKDERLIILLDVLKATAAPV